MRHNKSRFQLNRFTSWRRATVLSLVKNLIIYQSIRTTKVKAQAAKPVAEKLISWALSNTLAAKRQANKILGDHKLVSILFNEIGPRFKGRLGGYTRILGVGRRRGDNAEVVIFELTEIKKKEQKKQPKKEKEEKPLEEKKPEAPQEKPPVTHPESKKAPKKFLGGIRRIFKKERDSL